MRRLHLLADDGMPKSTKRARAHTNNSQLNTDGSFIAKPLRKSYLAAYSFRCYLLRSRPFAPIASGWS